MKNRRRAGPLALGTRTRFVKEKGSFCTPARAMFGGFGPVQWPLQGSKGRKSALQFFFFSLSFPSLPLLLRRSDFFH